MKNIWRRVCACGLAAALITLCACEQTEEAPPAPDLSAAADRQYSIYLDDGRQLTMDSDGNFLPEGEQSYILWDVRTGEAQCRYRSRVEGTGERDEYDNPIARDLASLLDMEGNVLRDWEETNYSAGFGNYIVKSDYRNFMLDPGDLPDDYHTALWDFVKGEDVMEGVNQVARLGEEHLLLSDLYGSPIAVVDADGEIYSEAPAGEEWYEARVWKDYIIVQTWNPYIPQDAPEEGKRSAGEEILLSKDFEPLLQRETLNSWYYGLYGEYLIYVQGEERGVISPDGAVALQAEAGERIDYFDGELAIVVKERQSEGGREDCRLQKVDGTVLAEGFFTLTSTNSHKDEEPARQFIGYRDDGIELLDRRGKALHSLYMESGDTYISPQGDGLYTFQSMDADGNYTEGMLGPELQIITPAGKYGSIYRMSEWKGNESQLLPYLQGWYSTGSASFVDVLDLEGNVLVEKLNTLYDSGYDRIVVRKGFDVGLMDLSGNWIARQSIFTELIDD